MDNDPGPAVPDPVLGDSVEYLHGYAAGRFAGYAEGVEHVRLRLSLLASSLSTRPSGAPPLEVQEVFADIPLATPIENLRLRVRTYNCLKREGLHTVGHVMKFAQERDLAPVRNFGQKSVDELREALRAKGYTLPDPPS